MNLHWIKRISALALTALLAVMPVSADTIGGGVVHTSEGGLNLCTQAAAASASRGTIPSGSFLLVEEALDGWYKVVYNGAVGYVSADYVTFSQTMDGAYAFGAATAGTDVNLRAGASTVSSVLKRIPSLGAGLTVTGVSGNWLRVRDAAGTEGFVRSDLVNYQETAAPAAGAGTAAAVSAGTGSAIGQQIAATAKQYLGYRYTWGGKSPETGFDCSGFANYIYGLYGYSLERVAQNIYSSSGTAVDRNSMQPGDILCFGCGPGSIGHVGIYIGNGQMVHAGSSATGVILTDLSDGYYASRLIGVKRIV